MHSITCCILDMLHFYARRDTRLHACSLHVQFLPAVRSSQLSVNGCKRERLRMVVTVVAGVVAALFAAVIAAISFTDRAVRDGMYFLAVVLAVMRASGTQR